MLFQLNIMILLNKVYLVGLITALAVVATPNLDNACGKLNVIFTLVSKYNWTSKNRLTDIT
jgi:hypothetical protein